MKYGRGRIIAVALLSIVLALSLSGLGVLLGYRTLPQTSADEANQVKNSAPVSRTSFDSAYKKNPSVATNTGKIDLGRSYNGDAILAIREECYQRGSLSEYLNSATRRNFNSIPRETDHKPYPLYSNNEMELLKKNFGSSVKAPVVMLDTTNTESVVVVELLNLNNLTDYRMFYNDGYMIDDERIELKAVEAPSSLTVNDDYTEYVYTGIETREELSEAEKQAIIDNNNNLVDDNGDPDPNNPLNPNYIDINKIIERLPVRRSPGNMAYTMRGQLGCSLRGLFNREGYYQFYFKVVTMGDDGSVQESEISFDFYIVDESNYVNFPSFPAENRTAGRGEVYNYSYGSDYPSVIYETKRFEVQVNSLEDFIGKGEDNPGEYEFYNIGEYTMVSKLKYMYRDQYLDVSNYQSYTSTLNIKGFQAYRGFALPDTNGNLQYTNGMLPFFSSDVNDGNSNITAAINENQNWVNSDGFKLGDLELSKMPNPTSVDALAYSELLVELIQEKQNTTPQAMLPVQTNFPPVKIMGNVNFATGKRNNQEEILSTVAYHGITDFSSETKLWHHQILEVGKPFYEVGEYIVTVYFKVNSELCRQVFYFEITNAIDLSFEVGNSGEKLTFNDLAKLDHFATNQVFINYNGATTLGKYEVAPRVKLEWAKLEAGKRDYSKEIPIITGQDGSFSFLIDNQVGDDGYYHYPNGHYRLTVTFDAFGKSQTIAEITVDHDDAGIIIPTSNAKQLALPGDIKNIAVFGVSSVVNEKPKVALSWQDKISGIGYKSATVTHYALTPTVAGDPNDGRNNLNNAKTDPDKFYQYAFNNSNKLKDLFAGWDLKTTPDENTKTYFYQAGNNQVLLKTDDGWMLSDSFTQYGSGVYEVVIEDDVGNQTDFILIIDDSKPTFTQSVRTESTLSNVTTNFSNNNPVVVAFGQQKLIDFKSFKLLNTAGVDKLKPLKDAGIIDTEHANRQVGNMSVSTNALEIPFRGITGAGVFVSVNGGVYEEISESAYVKGYLEFNQENTYYVRIVDVLGNRSEYYIVLTNDRCLGSIFAEDHPQGISTKGCIEDDNDGNCIDPTGRASMVITKGGMTNRDYLSFSFYQTNFYSSGDEDCRVKNIEVAYYEFNFDRGPANNPNPNYPFARTPSYKTIYMDVKGSANRWVGEKTYRIPLYNGNNPTEQGMYIITRTYSAGGTDIDPLRRNYWIIVDNRKMLDYDEKDTNEDKYQTDLKIDFDGKLATAEIFKLKNYFISSDVAAEIVDNGFTSKYQRLVFLENRLSEPGVYGFEFLPLIPRFSVTNNGITEELGEGTNITNTVIGANNQTGDYIYNLMVADNARSWSAKPINGRLVEIIPDGRISSSNYTELRMFLDTGHGSKAQIEKVETVKTSSGNATQRFEIDNSAMKYVKANQTYHYAVDPQKTTDLKFEFSNDPKGFYADINLEATNQSWRMSGVNGKVAFEGVEIPEDGTTNVTYSYDILQNFLTYHESIQDGDWISVTLTTESGKTTVYTIWFDTEKPQYNLTKLANQDNLAIFLTKNGAKLPQGYVYGMANDFIFESDPDNPYLGTRTIAYREVNAKLVGDSKEKYFDINKGVYFSDIVNLPDNALKYYLITEKDYAGHVITYAVQLQGSAYQGGISFVGEARKSDAGVIFGVNMRVRESSMDRFWSNNAYFRFECGKDYYMAMGEKAEWTDANGKVCQGDNTVSRVITMINTWLDAAAVSGKKTTYRLYDRIGKEAKNVEFYNLAADVPMLKLECFTETGTDIYLHVMNDEYLPNVLTDNRNREVMSEYQITIWDDTEKAYKTTEGISFNMPYTSLNDRNSNIDSFHDLIITVMDPFGREVMTEYHRQGQGSLAFITSGRVVDKIKADGTTVTYVGDGDGVKFKYMLSLCYVTIYDEKGNQVNNIAPVVEGDWGTYRVYPMPVNDTRIFRFVAIGRLSGAVMEDRTFAFDTRLPEIRWKNASDQLIDLNGVYMGSVNMEIVNDPELNLFDVSVSYTRKHNGEVERVNLRPNQTTYQFNKVGTYQINVISEIWARRTYEFEIAESNESVVSVSDDNKEIHPSEILFEFNNPDTGRKDYIKNYIFTASSTIGEGFDFNLNGLSFETAASANRVLMNKYQEVFEVRRMAYYDIVNGSFIWCLATESINDQNEKQYGNKFYFATTPVLVQDINRDNPKVTLIINDVDLRTSDRTYEVLTDVDNQGVTVKLKYDASQGIPYNQVPGNSLLVECRRNGHLVKTFGYDEKFNFTKDDAGHYEFIVRDLVNNRLQFGSGNDRTDKYVIVNLSSPMILINDDVPINNMVYNDVVKLRVNDYADKDILRPKYGNDFNKYFYISDMEVRLNNEIIVEDTFEERAKDPNKSQLFTWVTPGVYEVSLNYVIGENGESQFLRGKYSFRIVPSNTPIENFNITVDEQLRILEVRKNTYLLPQYNDLEPGRSIALDNTTGNGYYQVILQTNNKVDGIKTHKISFVIGEETWMGDYFNLSTTIGSSTKNPVNLTYRPFMLFISRGEITIELYKNNVCIETETINQTKIEKMNVNSEASLQTKDAGEYMVKVYDINGRPVYATTWTIEKSESPMGMIVTAIVAGVAGVGLILFLRMRRKMTVK